MFWVSIKRRCDGVSIEMDVKNIQIYEVSIGEDTDEFYLEMRSWCEDYVKGNRSSSRYLEAWSRFVFCDEEDAVAFKLRWV